MLRNFQELFEKAKARGTIRVAVAAAQDLEVIEAIQAGIQAGLIEAILVGEGAIIGPMSEGMGISAHVRIIHEPDMAAASLLAAGLVREGEAQVLMKGLVNSAIFLRGALDANRGLRTGRLLSHLVALEIPGEKKLAFYTDGGMNIEPGSSRPGSRTAARRRSSGWARPRPWPSCRCWGCACTGGWTGTTCGPGAGRPACAPWWTPGKPGRSGTASWRAPSPWMSR